METPSHTILPPGAETGRAGRLFSAGLEKDSDLVEGLFAFCRANGIESALAWLSGSVSPVTLGIYDPSQEVSATERYEGVHELVSASGRIIVRHGLENAHLTASAAGLDGKLVGGRIFSPTRAVAVRFDLMEILS